MKSVYEQTIRSVRNGMWDAREDSPATECMSLIRSFYMLAADRIGIHGMLISTHPLHHALASIQRHHCIDNTCRPNQVRNLIHRKCLLVIKMTFEHPKIWRSQIAEYRSVVEVMSFGEEELHTLTPISMPLLRLFRMVHPMMWSCSLLFFHLLVHIFEAHSFLCFSSTSYFLCCIYP